MTFYPNYNLSFPNYAGTLGAAGMNFGTGFDMNFGLNFNTGFTPNFNSLGNFNNFMNFNGFGNFGGFGGFGNSGLLGNFGNSGGIGTGFDTFATNFGSSASSTKEETYEEYQARKAKEREHKKSEYKRLQDEIKQYEEKIKQADEALNEAQPQIDEIKKNTKKDGSSEVKKKLSEMSLIDKIGLAASGAVNGMFDTFAGAVKTIAGFDKDGKWSLGRCLLGVGTTALLALACTPAAAVAIPALAFAPAVLSAVGIGAGAVMAGVGVKNVVKGVKHDSAEEFKDGFGQITTGAVTGIMAGRGLKASGGLKTANANYKEITTMKNTNALAYSDKSPFARFKISLNQYRTKKIGDKINIAETKYKKDINDIKSELSSKIKNIDDCLHNSNTTDINKIESLKRQREIFKTELDNLNKAVNGTAEDWNIIGNSTKRVKLKWTKRVPFTREKALKRSLKGIDRTLTSVKKEKFDLMTQMSKTDIYRSEVENFGFTTKHHGLKNYLTKFRYDFKDMTLGQKMWKIVNAAFIYFGPEYTFAPIFKKNVIFHPGVAYACTFDLHNEGMGDMLAGLLPNSSATQVYTAEEIQEYEKQIAELKQGKNDLVKQVSELTKKQKELYA